jgi:hypothetical protein
MRLDVTPYQMYLDAGVSSKIKKDTTNICITEILLKVALNTTTQPSNSN